MAEPTHQWMRHAEHGGVAQLPVAAEKDWRAKGWEPCEAPAEIDPAMVEHVSPFADGPSLADLTEPEAEPGAGDDAEERTHL